MRAAAAWDVAPPTHLDTPGRPGSAAGRARHLHVVPAPDVDGRSRRGLRITRLGRLVFTLLFAALVATAALSSWAGSAGSAGPVIDHSTTVRAGQTLSEIAARELPALPIQEGVWALQLANNLSSVQVEAGQVLLVPAFG